MSKENQGAMSAELFKLDGKPSIGQALPLALQHVVAMIVGCVTPAIIVSGVAGLSDEDSVILIQAALVLSAVTTLLQLFPIIRGKAFSIGSGDQFCLCAYDAGDCGGFWRRDDIGGADCRRRGCDFGRYLY